MALSKEISAVTSEIDLQKRAFGGYQKALNKVGLDSKLAEKVRNGSIDIAKYGSDTQKKIKEYQDLYEKMLKTADAAQELNRTLSELYKQRFDTVANRWDNQTENIKFTYDRRESDISRRSDKYNSRYGKYGRLNASEDNITDYNRQIVNAEKQRDKQNRKAIALQRILDTAVSRGTVKKGSEQYYDMLNEIRSAQKEVDSLNEDIIDNTNKIAEEYINMFDIIQTNWDNSIGNLQYNYDHIENLINRRSEKSSEYVSIDAGINSSKKNITEYDKLISNSNKQLKRRRSELTELQKTLNKALKSGEIKKSSEDYYDMLSKIRDVRKEIDDISSGIVSNTNNIAEEYVNVFDKLETKFENKLESLNRDFESTQAKIEKRNANANDYNSKSLVSASAEKNIDDYKELNNIANKQIKLKREEIKALQAQLDNAVKKGAITKSSEQYQEMLSTIQSKQKDIDDMNISIINNTKNIAEEYKKMFDEIASNASNSAAVLDHYTKGYNTQMDIATAKGYATSANYYAKLKAIEEMNAKDSKKLAGDLQKQLNEAVQTGAIKLYSQAWYDMTNQIRKAKEETDSATASMLKYANQIQKVNWDRFDYLNDRLSEIRDESEFLIDLMSDEKMFDDAGKVTEYGMATIGLHTMNYDSYLNQVRRYANELSSINEQLAKDPNNTTLIDRRKDLLETQRDLILASQKEKESIKDLIEDGLEQEADALDDLIDKYLDALDYQKDLYDYQKKVANQTDEIASIQKQLSAYSGDNSSESLAKIQKLNEDLKKAEEDLRETEYDKYVSDSKKMLSDLKDEFEQRMNDRLDNIDGLIAELSGDVDNNKESICKTLEEQASDVGYTLTSSMESVWSSASDVLSSTNQTLSDISASVSMIWAAADKLAQTSTKSVVDESNKSKYTGTVNVNGKQFYYSGGQKQVGWQTVSGNKRYYNTKDGDMFKGFHKIGSATYYFDPKTGNLKTGTFTVGNMSYQTDKNGKILKKAKKGTNQWKKYASGSRRISHDQFGWTNESGQEMLYRNGSGAILTPLGTGDKVFSNSMADTLWNISKPGGIEQIIRGITHGTGSISAESYRSMLNAIGTGTSVNQNFENITFSLPNVKDYDSLVRQMQSDNKFEKLIQSMTIGRLNGKSKNDKKRIIF